MCEKNHYAYMVGAVELMKNKMFENVKKPSLKKYLLCIEVYKWRCKDWNYKERRMKAISSESGMDIT